MPGQDGVFGTWPQWRRLLPHVLTATDASRALDHAGDDVPLTLNSASNLAADLRALGQHEAAHQLDEDTETRRRAAGN